MGLIGWLHPGTVLKWILGLRWVQCVAIPNYGPFAESTIPDYGLPRHSMIFNLPLVTYVVTEFATQSMR